MLDYTELLRALNEGGFQPGEAIEVTNEVVRRLPGECDGDDLTRVLEDIGAEMIEACCEGERDTWKGMHWKYVEGGDDNG